MVTFLRVKGMPSFIIYIVGHNTLTLQDITSQTKNNYRHTIINTFYTGQQMNIFVRVQQHPIRSLAGSLTCTRSKRAA